MTQFTTIDSIVDDIQVQLNAGDFEAIKATPRADLAMFHHSAGQMIRNKYSLWHTSPLTEQWRTDESSHDIRDGVDYSEDHPDAVSMKVIEALWDRLTG